jgi:hypothetical protein
MSGFGKVEVFMGGRAGHGVAQRRCGTARGAAQETLFAGMMV